MNAAARFSIEDGAVPWECASLIMGKNAISLQEMMRCMQISISEDDVRRFDVVNFSHETLARNKDSAILFPADAIPLVKIANLPLRTWRRVISNFDDKTGMWFHSAPFFKEIRLERRWYLLSKELFDVDDLLPNTQVPFAAEVAFLSILFYLARRPSALELGKWPFDFKDKIYCRDIDEEDMNIVVGPFLNNGLYFSKDRRMYERRQHERRMFRGLPPEGEPERRHNSERRIAERRSSDILTAFSHLPIF